MYEILPETFRFVRHKDATVAMRDLHYAANIGGFQKAGNVELEIVRQSIQCLDRRRPVLLLLMLACGTAGANVGSLTLEGQGQR